MYYILEVVPIIFAEHVKSSPLSLIREMAAISWLFVKNPTADFSRTRKLDFASTVQLILSMESGSLQQELLSDYFLVYKGLYLTKEVILLIMWIVSCI